MIKVSLTGTELSLVHKTPTSITESTWWTSPADKTIQLKLHKSNSTPNATSHALTNKTVLLNHTNSPCSKTGTQHTPWKKSSSDSRTRWSLTRNSLNQLMVICTETDLAEILCLVLFKVLIHRCRYFDLDWLYSFTLKSRENSRMLFGTMKIVSHKTRKVNQIIPRPQNANCEWKTKSKWDIDATLLCHREIPFTIDISIRVRHQVSYFETLSLIPILIWL